jgi:DNA polymerase-3 subunit beta
VECPGKALLPARVTVALLRASLAEELTVETCPSGTLVRSPGTRYYLEAPSPDLFEPLDTFPIGSRHLLDSARLRRAVLSTLFATGGGSKRYCLEAVLCEVEQDRLRLVATDNLRLAVAELPALSRCDEIKPAARLLPAIAVALLARLAVDDGERVEAMFAPKRAYFRVGGCLVSARYVDGAYPRWRSAVPSSPPHCLDLPVGPFLSAVRQAAVLREPVGGRLLLRLEPGRLVLESYQTGAGRSRVARQVPFAGEPIEVALHPRFLVELLRCLEGEPTVMMGLTNADTAALFRAGDKYTHLLMPLRPFEDKVR